MTKIMDEEKICAICGAKHKQRVLLSTNAFGSSDLDLRPPEMQRSTMHTWVQECPSCGYVAVDISEASNVSVDYLKSEEYCTCDHIDFASALASRFYKLYKIKSLENDIEASFDAALHAAWACDDADDKENAVRCREIAIALVDQLIDTISKDRDTFILLKVDLLRRAGRFRALLSEYKDVRFDDDLLNAILAFHLKLAKNGDVSCYQISDATQDVDP